MLRKQTLLAAALLAPLTAAAQTTIGFEDASQYAGIGVYDSWPQSPFRTGALEGNVKVISNELNAVDDFLGSAPNGSAKMLAFQRSRFAGNQYGARIDLATPIHLGETTKYVHVMLYKTATEGRVMLIGLGKRQDRPGQQETEQFKVLSSQRVVPGRWTDAVFPINGADGIDVNALVVVPDCESTHTLQADFAAYIDEIEVMTTALPRVTYGCYPVNFEKTDKNTGSYAQRAINSISLTSPSDGAQTIAVTQATDRLIYQDRLAASFNVKAGERVTPALLATFSTWMHSYIYLDRDNDGKFNFEINDAGQLPENTDVMSYSYYEGKNSNGATANAGSALNPLAFTVPADLAPGFYRLRYKVDWNSIDAGGNANAGNTIVANGGAVIDTRLNVHADLVTISRATGTDGVGGLNGDILKADGSDFTAEQIPFGQPYTILSRPAPGFRLSHVVLRHGYNLDGDSLVNETPQYKDEIIPAFLFRDNLFTIPAAYIDGDVSILPYFSSEQAGGDTTDDYPVNFDADTLMNTRTDRVLRSFTMAGTQGGSTSISVPTSKKNVYRFITNKQVSVVPGDEVTTTISYTGKSMHMYLYIDYDQDGQYSVSLNADGTPTISGELVSYTYYQGRNSLGAALSAPGQPVTSTPAFTLPAMLAPGVYRARLKVDWNNSDPGGQWAEDGTNNIDANGGYVIDFLLNVHDTKHRLTVLSTNGSVHGASQAGLPPYVTPFTALSIAPTPIEQGYAADSITIRHGINLDGPQYIHGNRQWSEYRRKSASLISLPKDTVNGDVVISVDFHPTTSATYDLVFQDEFEGNDGDMPDATKWTRSTRQNPTWKRFISINDEEHALTGFIENNEFVARCLPNPFKSTDNVDMISGAIQSSGKFSFLYGKIEGRLMTNPYAGNFPAFWLMPQDQSAGWPYCGEIDIWEQIDAQNTTYHTIHTRWANSTNDGALCQGQGNNPPKGGTSTATNGWYHTFGLEWTEDLLTWYVNGKKVFSYAKSKNASDLNLGQWPFDKPFYIILNQSVGNGSWASPAVTSHTYETRFDWVRVYQKSETVGIAPTPATPADRLDVTAGRGVIHLAAPDAVRVTIVDLAGRTLFSETLQGNRRVAVPTGLYLVNGRKVSVR